ncbi:MAG: aryl-sulfate sulfotransferase [Parabacteroides sp.]|nr:aryl-sulfate sulfotransferase [Parabacteroides sp.]
MKNLKYGLFLLGLLLAVACSNDEGMTAGDLIESIQARVRADNALRVDLEFRFRTEAAYRVTYWKVGEEASQQQTALSEPALSDVATLVFLEPQTMYRFKVWVSAGGETAESDEYSFTTGRLPADVPLCSVLADNLTVPVPGYILLMQPDMPGYIVVVNPQGTVVWYEKMEENVIVATFDPEFNTFACIVGTHPAKAYTGKEIVVLDIYGNRLLERPSTDLWVHHDVRRLPDGNLVAVCYVSKPFDLSARGGGTQEVVWGDGYVVLDMKGNVVRQWDCFRELNPQDDPHIMEVVAVTSVLAEPITYREDWLHANSVNFDAEGNFYMSFNWRSELWKIDGLSGDVLYRVGRNGTVELPEVGVASGMHSNWPLAPDRVLVYDNGLTNHISRALIYRVDGAARRASVELVVPLDGAYASAYMSSVRMVDENLLLFGGTASQCIVFTDREGTVLRTLGTMMQSYRAEYIPFLRY